MTRCCGRQRLKTLKSSPTVGTGVAQVGTLLGGLSGRDENLRCFIEKENRSRKKICYELDQKEVSGIPRHPGPEGPVARRRLCCCPRSQYMQYRDCQQGKQYRDCKTVSSIVTVNAVSNTNVKSTLSTVSNIKMRSTVSIVSSTKMKSTVSTVRSTRLKSTVRRIEYYFEEATKV